MESTKLTLGSHLVVVRSQDVDRLFAYDGCILVGSRDYARQVLLADIFLDHSMDRLLRVRAFYQLDPEIAFNQDDRIAFRLDDRIALVSVSQRKLLSEILLPCAGTLIARADRLIVAGEIDLLVLDWDGAELKRQPLNDIVVGFELIGPNRIKLMLDDGSSESFDIP